MASACHRAIHVVADVDRFACPCLTHVLSVNVPSAAQAIRQMRHEWTHPSDCSADPPVLPPVDAFELAGPDRDAVLARLSELEEDVHAVWVQEVDAETGEHDATQEDE